MPAAKDLKDFLHLPLPLSGIESLMDHIVAEDRPSHAFLQKGMEGVPPANAAAPRSLQLVLHTECPVVAWMPLFGP